MWNRLTNSVKLEWSVVDELSFLDRHSEVVENGRIGGIPDDIVRHKGLLLVLQCCFVAHCSKIVFAHPLVFVATIDACKLIVWGAIVGRSNPYAWLDRRTELAKMLELLIVYLQHHESTRASFGTPCSGRKAFTRVYS